MAGFETLVKKLETAYHKAFGADPLNWLCLMNNAYQEKPYNPHVHWHLIPRHENSARIGDLSFEDTKFGHMLAPHKERLVDDKIVEKIAEKIKAYL